jgi:hypothetical protein
MKRQRQALIPCTNTNVRQVFPYAKECPACGAYFREHIMFCESTDCEKIAARRVMEKNP